jgi:hypothetical protein
MNLINLPIFYRGKYGAIFLPSISPSFTAILKLLSMSALPPIVLQKSFGGDERNFLGPLMCFERRDVRDLIVHPKNGHGASHRRRRVLQRRSRLKFDFREIFGVVRFSTFATLSEPKRTFADHSGFLSRRFPFGARPALRSLK